ncbi:MAG: site-2 protease family protein [Candidatus Nanoarchaeia archaeon]
MNFFISQLFENPSFFFSVIILVVFSVCCHEYAHAWMALHEGDETAARNGHLTLNPLKQMGIFSLVMLLFLGITWGSVPVNPRNMRRRHSAALVAFAGPFANLTLFLIFCFLSALAESKGGAIGRSAFAFFFIGASLNAILFIFNMMPIPILDGFTIFSHLFPSLSKINQEVRNGMIFLIFMLVFFSFSYIQSAGFFITGIVQGFFLKFLVG